MGQAKGRPDVGLQPPRMHGQDAEPRLEVRCDGNGLPKKAVRLRPGGAAPARGREHEQGKHVTVGLAHRLACLLELRDGGVVVAERELQRSGEEKGGFRGRARGGCISHGLALGIGLIDGE